jgi:aminocarboxymuconate-semialdehyde decarboxylase
MKEDVDRREFMKKLGLGAAVVSALEGSVSGTAMAQTAAPQRNTGRVRSVDMHSHWSPDVYNKAFAAKIGKPPDEVNNPLYVDREKRTQWMNSNGIQVHLLTLSGRMPWWQVSPADGAELAQIINDEAIVWHNADPTRFFGAAELPVRDPQMALKELNRVAGKPGIRAVHVPNSLEGQDYLFEPGFEPVFARIEELGYPLTFHPLDGEPNMYGGKDRLGGRWGLSNPVGFPAEHSTTAAKFIVSGTLDKFPRLEVVLPHAGGSFPFIAGRMERSFKNRKPPLPHTMREYVRRFHYDSLAFWPEALKYVIDVVGSDRVVLGTDIYYAMDEEHPVDFVDSLKLPAADRDRIVGGNAARLLKL